jgi:hypothetical protein
MAAKKKVVKKAGRPLMEGQRGLQVTIYMSVSCWNYLQQHATPTTSMSKLIRVAVEEKYKIKA